MNRQKNQLGFGIIEVLLALAVIAALGFGGWLVLRHSRKTTNGNGSTQTSDTKSQANQSKNQSQVNAATSDELVNAAKQVYFQQPGSGDNIPYVAVCGTQASQPCSFTDQFAAKIDNTKIGSSSGANQVPGILLAGIQNGPFGTLTYEAVPDAQGGSVTVHLTPNTSAGGAAITWKLSMVLSGGKLLVDDILYSQTANGARAACNAVEIYNYPSCFE
jgi:Tfp pilus assembly protein PilV